VKDTITVHATMTKTGENLTIRDVDLRDRKFGFSKVGYHYVIERDGSVNRGRDPETEASLHDDFGLAKRAISVCLIGGLNEKSEPADNFTDDQKDSLRLLVQKIQWGTEITVKAVTPSLGDLELEWIRSGFGSKR
jgi:N-acetylmuramoyl-L-alanine amidase